VIEHKSNRLHFLAKMAPSVGLSVCLSMCFVLTGLQMQDATKQGIPYPGELNKRFRWAVGVVLTINFCIFWALPIALQGQVQFALFPLPRDSLLPQGSQVYFFHLKATLKQIRSGVVLLLHVCESFFVVVERSRRHKTLPVETFSSPSHAWRAR
jgi:hypothetical protein